MIIIIIIIIIIMTLMIPTAKTGSSYQVACLPGHI